MLSLVGLLFVTGMVIAIVGLIDFCKHYKKQNIEKKHRGFFGKLRDIFTMGLWVVMSAIWYVLIFIIEFIESLFEPKKSF